MELTKFEQKVISMIHGFIDNSGYLEKDFIEDLRKIMPLTCTETERKFLDEIKGRGEYLEYANAKRIVFGHIDQGVKSTLYQDDFETDLKDLIEGK
jgi:hypothetical protein